MIMEPLLQLKFEVEHIDTVFMITQIEIVPI